MFTKDTLQEDHDHIGFGVQEEFKDFEDEEEDFNQINNAASQNKQEEDEKEVPVIDDDDPNDYSLVFLEKYHNDNTEE